MRRAVLVFLALVSLSPSRAVFAAASCPKDPSLNGPPVANADSYPYPYTNPLTVVANDYDPDGDPIEIDQVLSWTPPNATWEIVDSRRSVKFVLPDGITTGSFRYSIRDGVNADRPEATATIATAGKQVDFAASCTGPKCSFTALPLDPNGIRYYAWKFNDLVVPYWTGVNYYLEFPWLPPGATQTHQVTLTVSYYDGAEGRITKPVTVTGLQHDATYTVRPTNYGQGAIDSLRETVELTDSTFPDNTNTSRYLFTFQSTGAFSGDPLLQNPGLLPARTNLLFTAPGTFEISFRVDRQTSTDGVRWFPSGDPPITVGKRLLTVVDGPPAARFGVVKNNGQSFTFDPSDSFQTSRDDRVFNATDYQFEWDFGDGEVGTSACPGSSPQAVTHVYKRSGNYTVYFKITDVVGGHTNTANAAVTVDNIPPVAAFDYTCAGLTCAFDGAASDDEDGIQSWDWTFGDGTTQSAEQVTRTFAAPGCYQIDLRVTDLAGSATTKRRTVTVSSVQPALPGNITVDSHPLNGWTKSDLNGILEPDEIVMVEPSRAVSTSAAMTGTIQNYNGPSVAVYPLYDTQANYGTPAIGARTNCWATGDCYLISASAGARPAQHWDATLRETNSVLGTADFLVHIGDTFTDVPRSNSFYRYVEAMAHWGITSGCAPRQFCPSTSSRRDFVIFLMRSRNAKLNIQAPACTTPPFADIPCSDFGAPYILQAKQLGATNGCDGVNFCPNNPISRAEVAVMVIKALGITPPPCGDFFADVQCTPTTTTPKHWAADFISELYRRGLTTGCSTQPRNFCPNDVVTRDAMSAFAIRAFDLGIAFSECAPGVPVQ